MGGTHSREALAWSLACAGKHTTHQPRITASQPPLSQRWCSISSHHCIPSLHDLPSSLCLFRGPLNLTHSLTQSLTAGSYSASSYSLRHYLPLRTETCKCWQVSVAFAFALSISHSTPLPQPAPAGISISFSSASTVCMSHVRHHVRPDAMFGTPRARLGMRLRLSVFLTRLVFKSVLCLSHLHA